MDFLAWGLMVGALWAVIRFWPRKKKALDEPEMDARFRAARLIARQHAMTERMRREGRHLLADKPYKPALTSPKEAKTHPGALDNVVAIRRRK
jgi:hypothetical protein